MGIAEEMRADIQREQDKLWERSKGLAVGESAGIYFAAQINPRTLVEELKKSRYGEGRGK